MANRTWPVPEPKGWQHTEEFKRLYPTPAARRVFYEGRRKSYDYVRRGFCRVADIYERDSIPEALHGPRPAAEVEIVILERTTI